MPNEVESGCIPVNRFVRNAHQSINRKRSATTNTGKLDLKIKGDYHILDKCVKTIIFTEVKDKSQWLNGIYYEVIDFTKNRPQQICEVLHKHNITSVLIEGGAKTLQSFIDVNLWDEARVVTGKINFGDGLKAPKFSGNIASTVELEADVITIFEND